MAFEEITFAKQDMPFKLCTTTFIHPAGWATNARALGRSFDELELLLFESARRDSLPDRKAVAALADLGADLGFTWNVHLPIDVYPGHPDRKVRQQAADAIMRVIELTAPLDPSTRTLHLPGITGEPEEPVLHNWQERLRETLKIVTDSGIPGRSLSIENITDYPLEKALPLIEEFDMEICLDIGHLTVNGFSIESAFKQFGDRISILHIHGVEDGRDHRSLDRMPPKILASLFGKLRDFKGIVSLEVFSQKHLLASLECLQREWGRLDQNKNQKRN